MSCKSNVFHRLPSTVGTMKLSVAFMTSFVLSIAFSEIQFITERQNRPSLLWLLELINFIDQITEGTLNVALFENSSSSSVIDHLFNEIRSALDVIQIPKYEGAISADANRRIVHIIDGSDPRKLRVPSLKTPHKLSEYVVIVTSSAVSQDHLAALRSMTFYHLLLLDVGSHPVRIYRVSSADHRLIGFGVNSTLSEVLNDRTDWIDYEVRILVPTIPPFAVVLDGELVGVDVQVCKAVFQHASMRYPSSKTCYEVVTETTLQQVLLLKLVTN